MYCNGHRPLRSYRQYEGGPPMHIDVKSTDMPRHHKLLPDHSDMTVVGRTDKTKPMVQLGFRAQGDGLLAREDRELVVDGRISIPARQYLYEIDRRSCLRAAQSGCVNTNSHVALRSGGAPMLPTGWSVVTGPKTSLQLRSDVVARPSITVGST